MIIAANWKMNPLPLAAASLFDDYCVEQRIMQAKSDVICFVPSCYFALAAQYFSSSAVEWGAQNSFPKQSGAYTGELSAEMIKGFGGAWVLAGHSERRNLCGEKDSFIGQKLVASLKAGLKVILCVGEEKQQRQIGRQNDYVCSQLLAGLAAFCCEPAQWQARNLPNLAIAYEPVWAIGTGLTASVDKVAEIHHFIRSMLSDISKKEDSNLIPILYGGSVNSDNAEELIGVNDVNGFLIGGAS